MNWIVIHPDELSAEGVVILRERRARHVRTVLRLTPGAQLRVSLLGGGRGVGDVLDSTPGDVTLRCSLDAPALPASGVSLLLALPRPKVLRRLWRSLAELGVDTVVLVNAEKVERNYFDTHWLEPVHYRPLLIEGLEQSGETRLPRVRIERRLRPFVEDSLETVFPDHHRVFLDPHGSQPLQRLCRSPRRALLAIGPEGGWSDFECGLLSANGFTAARLGSRILRSDTACVAAVSVACQSREDQASSIDGLESKNRVTRST